MPVQTILVQMEKAGQDEAGKGALLSGSIPISITAARLTYADSERKVHYEGGVLAKGADFTASAKTRRRLPLIPAVKPRIIRHLPVPASLTAWSPRTT